MPGKQTVPAGLIGLSTAAVGTDPADDPRLSGYDV